MTKLAQKAR